MDHGNNSVELPEQDEDDERRAHYARMLGPSVVRWLLNECPLDVTFQSVFEAFEDAGVSPNVAALRDLFRPLAKSAYGPEYPHA